MVAEIAGAAVDMQIVDSSVRSIDTAAVDMPFMWFYSHRREKEREKERAKKKMNIRRINFLSSHKLWAVYAV